MIPACSSWRAAAELPQGPWVGVRRASGLCDLISSDRVDCSPFGTEDSTGLIFILGFIKRRRFLLLSPDGGP